MMDIDSLYSISICIEGINCLL